MLKLVRTGAVSFIFISALTAGAPVIAADATPVINTPSNPIWLVLDIGAGGLRGEETGEGAGLDWEETYTDRQYYVAGSMVVEVSPHLSFQADAWTAGVRGDVSGTAHFEKDDDDDYTYDYWDSDTGFGAHATWNGDNHRIGLYGDLSFRDYVFGSLQVEGAVHHGNWHLGGYAGVEKGLTGTAAAYDATEWYGTLYATYYATPNLALTGYGGLWSSSSDALGEEGEGGRIGAAIEYKHDHKPFSVYALFTHFVGEESDLVESAEWSSNYVGVGFRWFLHEGTLQETDRHVF